jgi:hypothetical protein
MNVAPRMRRVTVPLLLVIGLASAYIPLATTFRQMKRTVVLPTRIVRAWPKQKNFQS